jgi:hypothetical protein
MLRGGTRSPSIEKCDRTGEIRRLPHEEVPVSHHPYSLLKSRGLSGETVEDN